MLKKSVIGPLSDIDLENVHNNLLMENTWDTKLHMPHESSFNHMH